MAYTLYNAIRLSTPNKMEPMGVEQFLPRWLAEEPDAQSEDELLRAKAARAFGVFGGVDTGG